MVAIFPNTPTVSVIVVRNNIVVLGVSGSEREGIIIIIIGTGGRARLCCIRKLLRWGGGRCVDDISSLFVRLQIKQRLQLIHVVF